MIFLKKNKPFRNQEQKPTNVKIVDFQTSRQQLKSDPLLSSLHNKYNHVKSLVFKVDKEDRNRFNSTLHINAQVRKKFIIIVTIMVLNVNESRHDNNKPVTLWKPKHPLTKMLF